MKTVTLDTHRFITLLESKGFSRDQAEGLVEAVKEIDTSELVTKHDLTLALKEQNILVLKLMLGQVALFTAIIAFLLDLFLS